MHQYCNVPMEFLRDINLPAGERGVYATLFSLPENWRFSIRGLEKILPDGKDRLSRILARLKELGYVDIIQKRGKKGFYSESEVNIWIQPRVVPARTIWQPGLQYPGDRDPEDRDSVTPPQSINKESTIHESIIYESIPAEPDPDSLYTGKPRIIPGRNRFNNFPQRQYKFDVLERELLKAQQSS